MNGILETTTPLAEQACCEIGVELLEIQYVPGRRKGKLRLTIDKESSSVSVGDCAEVSRRVSRLIDVESSISESYNLEVSSPGFKRKLRIPKDLNRFIGHNVRIKLSDTLYERKIWAGILKSTSDPLSLLTDKGTIEIPHKKIEKANLND